MENIIKKRISKKGHTMKEYIYHDVNLRGTIEKVSYRTTNRDGQVRMKRCNVYLPCGYDPEKTEKRYDILYLVHGGGGSQDAWLDCCKIKNMLDHTIDTGEIDPLIVVFPCFYKEQITRIGPPDADVEKAHVLLFIQELAEELLPAVEGRYHTWSDGGSRDALVCSRSHRAVGGFSMGSCTTWFMFLNHLDLFSRFVPLSGDCWAVKPMGGKSHPAETAEALRNAVLQSAYTPDDFRIFAATGSKDPACNALGLQIEAMKAFPDTFRFSDDFSTGNAHYFLREGSEHCYEHVMQYLYNYLPVLFS